jgi:GAF domain-containing protein
MASRGPVFVADLPEDEDESNPAPSAQSMAAAHQVGVKSVLTTPLYSHGTLLGVISLATSGLTQRTGQFGAGDRDIICAVASQLAAAIDTPATSWSGQGAPTSAGLRPEAKQGRSSLSTGQA